MFLGAVVFVVYCGCALFCWLVFDLVLVFCVMLWCFLLFGVVAVIWLFGCLFLVG